MKKILAPTYFVLTLFAFTLSLFLNQEYFYRLAYDNLLLYQLKQVASTLVLFAVGYIFMKVVQRHFNDVWVLLLSMPCGIALWVFVAQILLLTNITYTMYRVFAMIGAIIALGFITRKVMKWPPIGKMIPSATVCLLVGGTALLVSTGLNYVNMNYDSYLYFTNYGKVMALFGDYQAWNTNNAFVITNIGQFLATLNSYTAFWGLEYCLPILSFMVINMYAIFIRAVYEMTEKMQRNVRVAFITISALALISCTCVLVYGNWMLSNSFIMYYLTIAGILGANAPKKMSIDYALVLCGCSLAITLLRKDGIIVVCFLFVCYCCNNIAKGKTLSLLFLPSAFAQLYYIGYVRFFLKSDVHTALGTSILNNKFIILTVMAVAATVVYLLVVHPWISRWLGKKLNIVILSGMFLAIICAIAIKLEASIEHIDAIFHVLVSPAYGFSLLMWLLILALIFSEKIEWNYELLLVIGYCMLTFLIYWNKGNREQGIDNSGMRTFVQIVPMIFYGASKIIGERIEKIWKVNDVNY